MKLKTLKTSICGFHFGCCGLQHNSRVGGDCGAAVRDLWFLSFKIYLGHRTKQNQNKRKNNTGFLQASRRLTFDTDTTSFPFSSHKLFYKWSIAAVLWGSNNYQARLKTLNISAWLRCLITSLWVGVSEGLGASGATGGASEGAAFGCGPICPLWRLVVALHPDPLTSIVKQRKKLRSKLQRNKSTESFLEAKARGRKTKRVCRRSFGGVHSAHWLVKR